jgi:hypothetical protein
MLDELHAAVHGMVTGFNSLQIAEEEDTTIPITALGRYLSFAELCD